MGQDDLPNIATLSPEREVMLSELNSWATLQGLLPKLATEDDVEFLMKSEQQGKNRIRIIDRLYSRYCVIRKERERRDLSVGKLPF